MISKPSSFHCFTWIWTSQSAGFIETKRTYFNDLAKERSLRALGFHRDCINARSAVLVHDFPLHCRYSLSKAGRINVGPKTGESSLGCFFFLSKDNSEERERDGLELGSEEGEREVSELGSV